MFNKHVAIISNTTILFSIIKSVEELSFFHLYIKIIIIIVMISGNTDAQSTAYNPLCY